MNEETLDVGNEANQKKKEVETISQDIIDKLKELGFEEKDNKPWLWFKNLGDGKYFHWDFRKTKKGTAFVATEDGFMDIKEVKVMNEYNYIRRDTKEETNGKTSVKAISEEKTKAIIPASDKKAVGLLRGSERDIIRLMDHKIQLDSIIDASSDKKKLGEGLLWHELKFGDRVHVEPSAELVDLIAQDMGNISVKIVEFDTNTLEDPNSMKKYLTYYCVAEATDGLTHTSGLGAAEQIIDFDEIKTKGRTFARTLVIRKASRNAVERLIPIPRKAMVYLIRKKLDEHKKGK